LNIRKPDYQLGAVGSFGEQLGILMSKLENILIDEKPDAFLVLGDTNSSLGAIIAKRMGIKVFHMEAGNRCYDDRVPEETNRRLIDHSSDILLPYTERSRANLLREGIEGQRIYVTGNPIYEVLNHYDQWIEASDIMERLEVEKGKYFLVTLHRAENLDNPVRLGKFIEALNAMAQEYTYPIIWSVHPRTQQHLDNYPFRDGIVATKPLGLFEFVKLEKNAYCVLTDSGTVQEECALFGVPVVTLRDSTERPETIETGCNFISGCEPEAILRGIKVVTSLKPGEAPYDYVVENVSDTVSKIVLSYHDA
jgi:UDP-N-acetylglucosamine 2-epimerase (non-hydrolysing)